MSKLDCATIRRELDEIMLGEESGAAVSEHLAECNDCRDFNEKQMKLRQSLAAWEQFPRLRILIFVFVLAWLEKTAPLALILVLEFGHWDKRVLRSVLLCY